MMETQVGPAPRETATRLDALRARLVPPMPLSTFWGWAGPLIVTAFGTYLRFVRLGSPRAVIFDETYYVPDALGLLRFGVEHSYVSNRRSEEHTSELQSRWPLVCRLLLQHKNALL